MKLRKLLRCVGPRRRANRSVKRLGYSRASIEPLEERRLLALTVTVGTHTLLPNTPNQQIPIFVQGSDNIHGYELLMQIGDGAGSGGPPKMSYVGKPNNATGNLLTGLSNYFLDEGSDDSNVDFGFTLNTLNLNLPANRDGGGGAGLLGTLIIDTTGVIAGTWPLLAGGPNANNGDSDFFNQIGLHNSLVQLSITNGSITIDQPPAIDLNGAAIGADFSSAWFGSAAPIEDSTSTLTDPDDTNLALLTASLALKQANAVRFGGGFFKVGDGGNASRRTLVGHLRGGVVVSVQTSVVVFLQ